MKFRPNVPASEATRLHAAHNATVAGVIPGIEVTYPNDPPFSNQCALPKIEGPPTWPLVPGSNPVIIAIIDTGMDSGHHDLVGNVLAGYNFVKNNERAGDDDSHGTRVAGIAGATSDNSQGMISVAWQARYCRSESWPRWVGHLRRHSGR